MVVLRGGGVSDERGTPVHGGRVGINQRLTLYPLSGQGVRFDSQEVLGRS